MNQLVVLLALFGTALGGYQQQQVVAQPAAYAHAQPAYAAPAAAYAQYAHQPAPAARYYQPAYAQAQPQSAYSPAAVAPVLKSHAPQQYSQQIPAAAIRNVENVMVTKTITPVITKVTTHNSHSEPAISVGHVQGYSTHAHGPAKYAPVQYTTQYTQYLNPTVGDNGPVTYAGPAVSQGVAIQQGSVAVAAQPQPALLAAGPVGYAGQGQAVAYQQAAPAFAGPVGYAGQGQAFAYQQAAPAFAGPIGYAGHGHAVAYQQAAPVAYAHAAPAYAHAQPLAPGKIGTFDTGSYLHSHGYSGHF